MIFNCVLFYIILYYLRRETDWYERYFDEINVLDEIVYSRMKNDEKYEMKESI